MSCNSIQSNPKLKWEVSNVGGLNLETLSEERCAKSENFLNIDSESDSESSVTSNQLVFSCGQEIYTQLSTPESYLASLQAIQQDIIEVKETNKKLANELAKIKAKHLMSEAKIDENLDYIYFLEREVARLDQYGRRENVELIGIPESIGHRDLEATVIRILRKIGLDHIQHYNIAACHRLRSKDRFGNRNTIVRFVNRKDSISCLKSRKKLQLCRELGFNNIYITENLCPSNRSIFEELSNLKKRGS